MPTHTPPRSRARASKPRPRRSPTITPPPPTPPPTVPEPDLLYSADHAARFLLLSGRTLEKWRTTGEGPKFVHFGRRVVYRGKDLLAFVERQAARTTTAA